MIDPKQIEEWRAAVAYNDAPGTWVEESVDLGPAVTALLAERAELIALLRKVEWQGDISEGAGRPWCCPICMGSPERGHAPDCRLAAAIR